ncbi:NAD(P) transhydrogenase subunit alpha [Synechococcus sp. CCY9202]|uniref:NAD(P) transhydrogenase subunit alpha n=1 Tax=Synechococcus sp. CCY9202 TaxID=174698 RepID=UPI002B21F569|nr:NAD(P) transhydrogenase subunit alpha [Synechococcus sp. CCY9202]MEA5421729.1 NAD(P) transhydrogenase subunit alpha [Synechococcus sp. CCY9202]
MEGQAFAEAPLTRLLVPRERQAGECRVAATPETVRRLCGLGLAVSVEAGAGEASGYGDTAYQEAGAELCAPEALPWDAAEIVLCVQPPPLESLARLKSEALLIGLLAPYGADALAALLAERGASAIALELLPRISRAQSMDVLSSQANIAGYKAVLLAASQLDRYMPMLMTAAGTIQPARALILGAGVAGLQALATARRLGAVVTVSDVRPAAKEQVESLGGRFLEPPAQQERPAEAGGYAQAASEAFLEAQRQQLAEQLAVSDLVVCTAQVPGRPAPRLISEAMLDGMRPGAVVVDLAVAQGGNCAATVAGETVIRNGVRLIGADALPSSVANHASALYARNLLALIEYLAEPAVPGEAAEQRRQQLDPQDPILAGCLFISRGDCLHPEVLRSGTAAQATTAVPVAAAESVTVGASR